MVELGYKSPDRQNGATLAPIHLVNACSCPFCQRRWRVYCCAVRQNERLVLAVPPTLLRWHKSVSPTVRSPYPTGQVRRKESSRFAVSRNERHCAASAPHSDEMKGDASPLNSTPRPPLRGRATNDAVSTTILSSSHQHWRYSPRKGMLHLPGSGPVH